MQGEKLYYLYNTSHTLTPVSVNPLEHTVTAEELESYTSETIRNPGGGKKGLQCRLAVRH